MSRRRLEPDDGVTFRRVLRSCRANSKNGRKTKPGSTPAAGWLGLSERLQKSGQNGTCS